MNLALKLVLVALSAAWNCQGSVLKEIPENAEQARVVIQRRLKPEEGGVLVIRASSNVTYYIDLIPDYQAPVHNELIPTQSCHYYGTVVAPVPGTAAVSVCDGDHSAEGLIITERETLYFKPNGDHSSHLLIKPKISEQFCGVRYAPEVEDESEIERMKRSPRQRFRGRPPIRQQQTLQRTRRNKGSSTQKVVEIAVFVDEHLYKAMEKIYKTDTKNKTIQKVAAIMRQVQLIYDYNSMQTNFKLLVVKIEMLSKQNAPSTASGNIDKYLDNFCAWQCQRKSKDHWDHAILLTGLDLFKKTSNGGKQTATLGLAWVKGMCRCKYSCTINEGTDFEAAFIIAHELGHNLGMSHDGDGNRCDKDKFIMSDQTGPGKSHWSSCSNNYVNKAMQEGLYQCLQDEKSGGMDLTSFKGLPGETYQPKTQCLLALGTKYTPYMQSKSPFNDVCRELWCSDGKYATPAHPALDGTECAKGKWCREGACVTKK